MLTVLLSRYNGFGGKVEAGGETVLEAAVRELQVGDPANFH